MEKAVDTVVAGTVVTEDATFPDSCVAIAGGKVVGVYSNEHAPEAQERINCPGCLIMPGVVEAHVHSRSAAIEGLTNMTRAGAAGGVTTIIDMPGDRGAPVFNPERIAEKVRTGESESMVDFALWAAVGPGNLDQIEPMWQTGIVGFKMFMSESAKLGRMDDGSLLMALQEIGRLGALGAVHAENFEIVTYLAKKHRAEGRCGPEMHLASRPDVAEVDAVVRAAEFARLCGARLHFCHISLARSVEHIHRQRMEYPRLSVETCPQYLLLSEETIERIGSYGKINPPLRRVGETEAMWEQVRLGRVDLITTDHSPNDPDEKGAPCIFDNKSGMPGIETMLPLLYSEGVAKRQLPVGLIASLVSSRPARLFGLYPQKGALLPGSDADLVVLDPKVEWEVSAANLYQTSGWTAYEGTRVTGKPVLTMVRGRAVYRDGEIMGTAGCGRFVVSIGRGRRNETND